MSTSTAARPPGTRGRRAFAYVAVATLVGLLNASIVATARWSDGLPGKLDALLMELTGAYAFVLLLPAILAAIRRFPLGRSNWGRRLPLHLAFSMAFGVTHTLLMWGSRVAAYRLLGWGEYQYGVMRYRFLMEYQKQLLIYCIVCVVVAFVGYVQRSRQQELRAAALRSQLSQARLDALKMQLNPHFLFNTLNMISAHVHDDPDRAERMIARLSEFLRGTLHHSARQEIPLEEELELLRPYVDIMRARFEERMRFELQVAADCRRALVPHMLLQPIVENAVAHGLEGSTAGGRVAVAAERSGERLRISVEDDGPGLGEDGIGRGVGLGNTEQRLRELYGEDHRLELTNASRGGLRIALDLPWREAAREPAS